MVNIDTVYQRVLAIANKEQRGYITPQEFNLFANQAQSDIFEQYFYDIDQHERKPSNSTEYSNTVDLVDEKLSMFKYKGNAAATVTPGRFILPIDIYRLGTLKYKETYVIDEVKEDELIYLNSSPLSRPKNTRPIYTRFRTTGADDVIQVYPNSIDSAVSLTYIKQPEPVYWGYAVINGNALYDNTTAKHFQLHPSEEKKLVVKILALAGISIKDASVYQAAIAEENKFTQQEKQ
tara:strand:- start:1350 stop:2054 length:705 start_codon:yes stop_codon:yes gene_type:complete